MIGRSAVSVQRADQMRNRHPDSNEPSVPERLSESTPHAGGSGAEAGPSISSPVRISALSCADPPAAVDAVTTLIAAYLRAIDALASEPTFNIRGLLICYGKLFLWEVSILAVPFIGIVNAIKRSIARYSGTKPSLARNIAVDYTLSAFRSINAGEIPLLQLVTFRYFTRRLLVSHIRRRLAAIAVLLEREEMFCAFVNPEAKQAEVFPVFREKIMRLRAVLKGTSPFRSIVLLSPAIGVLSKVIGVDLPKWILSQLPSLSHLFAQLPAVLRLPAATSPPTEHHDVVFAFNLVVQMLVGLAVATLSSFIRKRRILAENRVFELESAAFQAFRTSRPVEFPFDLVGYPVALALPLSAPLLLSHAGQGRSDVVGPVMILAIPFVYAVYRRYQLHRL